MIQLEQIKKQYRKDLYSFRKLESNKYRGEKGARSAYVIAVCSAVEVLDQGFWNNDNLVEQFSYQNVKSTGSHAVDTIRDVALESEAEGKIQKASREGKAKMVFYANEGEDMVYADLIFYNQSKNRSLKKMLLIIDEEEGTILDGLKTYTATGGKTSYEDVVYLACGPFSEFREHFMGRRIKLSFHWEKDDNDETKDFISMTFDLKIQLVDYFAVKYVVDGSSWETEEKGRIIPFMEEKMEINKRRAELKSTLNQVNEKASKMKKRGCLGSVIVFVIYALAFEISHDSLKDWLMAVFVIGMIVPTIIGNIIGKKKAREGADGLSGDFAQLDHDEADIEKRMEDMGI